MYILLVNLTLRPWRFSNILLSVILIHIILFPLVGSSEGATHQMIFRYTSNETLPLSILIETIVFLAVCSETDSSLKADFGFLLS